MERLLHRSSNRKELHVFTRKSPGPDPIRMNHAKNIRMFFSKTICEDLKDVVPESAAQATYKIPLSLKPDSSAKRVEITKEVSAVESL